MTKSPSGKKRKKVNKNKKTAFHNAAPDGKNMKGAPREAIRREFGKRLQAAMLDKGWNQSELARHSGFGRDNISAYIRGVSIPGPIHLHAMANALNVKSDDLLPNKGMPSVDTVVPALDVAEIGEGMAWLRVNQAVDWDAALKIMALLKSADVVER